MEKETNLESILKSIESLDFKGLKAVEAKAKELAKKLPTYLSKQEKVLRQFITTEVDRELMMHETIVRDLSNMIAKEIDTKKTAGEIYTEVAGRLESKTDLNIRLNLNNVVSRMWAATGGAYGNNACADALLGYIKLKKNEKSLERFYELVNRRNVEQIKSVIEATTAANLLDFVVAVKKEEVVKKSTLVKKATLLVKK